MRQDLDQEDFEILIHIANALADAARVETLAYFRGTSLELENKCGEGFDPVTAADRAAEKAMREILARHRPDDAILGEEFGMKQGTSGLTWVLDPVDGTRGFMAGTPTWGVLVSVADADGPIYGLIDQPFIGERFSGGMGQAHYRKQGEVAQLAVRQTTDLADAVIFSTHPEVGSSAERDAFRNVASACRLTRYGMDCYAYALLAAGQVDLVIEAGLAAYDIQAPIAVIEAAGGIVTNWQGGSAHDGGQVIAAATPQLHKAALARLNGRDDV